MTTVAISEQEPAAPSGFVVACLNGPTTILTFIKAGGRWFNHALTPAQVAALVGALTGSEPSVFFAEFTE